MNMHKRGGMRELTGSQISLDTCRSNDRQYPGAEVDRKRLKPRWKTDSQKQFYKQFKFCRLVYAEQGQRSCRVWRRRQRPATGIHRIDLNMVYVAMRS